MPAGLQTKVRNRRRWRLPLQRVVAGLFLFEQGADDWRICLRRSDLKNLHWVD